MNTEQFTLNPDVVNIIDDLKQQFEKKEFIISDVIDDKGHQYIDLVQEGGGVLGIALLGYTYVLEQMGIRFLSLGGTSAGAINSLLIAACAKPEEPKSTMLLNILANKNLSDFEDGDDDAKSFINALVSKDTGIFKLMLKGAKVIDNFKEDMGLNPGEAFHQWLTETIASFGIHDNEDLERKMNELPESIRFRAERTDVINDPAVKINSDLAIIAAEINTETKIEFPRMRELFYENTDRVNPADYVRASMSIPMFYQPYTIENLPNGEESITNWKRIVYHRGGPPKKAMFVDGGVMSNFPIDVFHRVGLPTRPTFGVKLGLERVSNNDVNSISKLIACCFDAARNLRDFEFISKNPDYKKLVSFIDIGNHNWLDFEISDEDKVDLFRRGAQAAKSFLENFDWEEYKSVRDSSKNFTFIKGLRQGIEQLDKEKKSKFSSDDINTLEKRLLTIGNLSLHGLWIDDNSEYLEVESATLEKLGIKTTIVSGTEKAKELLTSSSSKFDFIISDINRDRNTKEGLEFANWINNVYPKFGRKIILYVFDNDDSKGVPPYAFGITDSVVELVHLVLDISTRR